MTKMTARQFYGKKIEPILRRFVMPPLACSGSYLIILTYSYTVTHILHIGGDDIGELYVACLFAVFLCLFFKYLSQRIRFNEATSCFWYNFKYCPLLIVLLTVYPILKIAIEMHSYGVIQIDYVYLVLFDIHTKCFAVVAIVAGLVPRIQKKLKKKEAQ